MSPEVSEAFLQQLVTALRESAAAQMAGAKASENVATTLKEVADQQRAMHEENNDKRDTAVEDLKNHITADVAAREAWWRWAFALAVGAVVVAQLLGVPVGRIISAILNIHP